MSKSRLIISLILFIIALPLVANVRILSICIGEYPNDSGWNSLGADNDARLIKNLFKDARVVANEGATHNRILNELTILNQNANRGDTIIIHFSGHGQQILSGTSSREADLVDEALVPYDAAKRKSGSYTGQAHINDDVFGEYISKIRKTVGANGLVIAVIDACHSNSMDKDADADEDVYRGTDEIFGAETLSADSIAKLRKLYNSPDESDVFTSPELSNVIFISACHTNQRNYEIKVGDTSYGSLTYYFCKAYEAKGISDLNEFLSDLYNGMSSDNTMRFRGQTPVIRSTVGWEAPAAVKAHSKCPTCQTSRTTPTCPKGDGKQWIYFAAAIIFLLLAGIVAWKKRK